jgi:hypothetical protein
VTGVCPAIKRIMPSIPDKSFPVLNLPMFKDIEVFLKVLLDDGLPENLLMELQVQFDIH